MHYGYLAELEGILIKRVILAPVRLQLDVPLKFH